MKLAVLSYADEPVYSSLLFLNKDFHRLLRQNDVLAMAKRDWFFNHLDLEIDFLCLPPDNIDWNSLLFEHTILWERLKVLPSPGNSIQKYLHWVDGVPAHSSPILRCIFLTSLLPPVEECFIKEGGEVVGPSNTVSFILRFLFSWITIDYCGYLRDIIPSSFTWTADWTAMIAMIDVRRCSRFLHWVTEPGKVYRLQQLLALIEGMQVRLRDYSFTHNRFYNLRLTKAYCAWVNLSCMNDAIMNYWAS